MMRRGASATFVAAVLSFASSSYAQSVSTSSETESCSAIDAGLEMEQMRAVFVQSRLTTVQNRATDPDLGTASFLLSGKALAMTAEERVALITPVAWFHVPKTGTSFCNTLYHTPGVCELFPREKYIGDSTSAGSWDPTWRGMDVLCSGGFSTTYRPATTGNHGGLDDSLWGLNRGHLVTMLRQPEQRLISGYNHEGHMEWPLDTPPANVREYAEVMAGGTVRQLVRGGGHASGELPLPTSDEVSVAIDRLKEGFAFVGITEQWDLSVCLFRAMFGGQCVTSDLANTRPGDNSSSYEYDTSELYGWVDAWDGPLYAEALLMFESALSVYGVDSQSCMSTCQSRN